MRLPLLPVLIVLATGIVTDGYIYRRLRQWHSSRIICIIYLVIAAVVTAGMTIVACASKKGASDTGLEVLMWTMFTYFSVYIPKYIFAIISLLHQLLSKIFKRRLRGITIGAASFCAALFVMMWWGAIVTRNSIDIKDVNVKIEGLPEAFDGYRIVQISDIHTGTFAGNPRFLEKVVKTINSVNPDIILFTGDIVNRHSSELEPFMLTLAELKAPDGVWSVMGNHDYGEYRKWGSETERLKDVKNLKKMQGDMGWHMLNNEHAVIRRGNDSIILIGVENIGDPPFTTYGNLRKAYDALSDGTTKILMSHNPAHWTDSISGKSDVNIALTLSGHTHAMQIELLGWSPASLRYHTWGGLYSDSIGHKLYVNIGLGEVGFPSRIGATPEITLITLDD